MSGTISVVSDSLDTKNKKRYAHLRSADLLNSEKYPHIVFTAQQATPTAGGGLLVTGTLRVRDRTRPLTVPVTVTTSGNELIQLDAEAAIDRPDFGLR